MNPGWVGVAIQGVIAGVGAITVVLAVRANVTSLIQGQRETHSNLQELTKAVAALTTSVAVNENEHGEIQRRLSNVEGQVSEHSETLRRVRTAVHLQANKIMEIDPEWIVLFWNYRAVRNPMPRKAPKPKRNSNPDPTPPPPTIPPGGLSPTLRKRK